MIILDGTLAMSLGLNLVQLAIIIHLWRKVDRLEKALVFYIKKVDKKK